MKNLLSLLLLAILVGMGAYFGSPYVAAWRLEQSAMSGDAAAIANSTDFAAVRANLSPHLGATLQSNIDAQAGNPHAFVDRVGLTNTPVLQPKPGDGLVTPEGLAVILKTAAPPSDANLFHHGRDADGAAAAEPYTIAQGYIDNDYDQFHVAIGNRMKAGSEVAVRLMRRGFLEWRVTAVDLQASGAATRAEGRTGPETTD